jgi:hypothetical protein
VIDMLDQIGDYIHGRPWLALGTALVCLVMISAVLSACERRAERRRQQR